MTITWKCRISRWQDVNTRQRLSFSFRDLRYSPLEFNSRKVRQHLTNWTRRNKPDKVWSGANSLSKWRFCNHRSRCCFSLGELESSKIFAEHALQVARIGFEHRRNSRALGIAGSINYDHWFINNRMLTLEKLVWRYKTRLTSPEDWAVEPSKAWHDSRRASFSLPRSKRRQKGALFTG